MSSPNTTTAIISTTTTINPTESAVVTDSLNISNNKKMEDNLSIKSSDSVTTSDEYEIVPEDHTGAELKLSSKLDAISPILNISNENDITDMEKNLTEVIHELEMMPQSNTNYQEETQKSTDVNLATTSSPSIDSNYPVLGVPVKMKINNLPSPEPDINKVGQSVFYDALDMSPMTEKQDDMKPERSDSEEGEISVSDVDQECTIFSGVTYLGAATINSPKSKAEIYRNMYELNSVSGPGGLKVSVSVPTTSEGSVVLYDSKTHSVVSRYEVHRIAYYTPGQANTSDACFAFTWSHGDTEQSAIYQCHIFRCQIPEAVTQVTACFSKAFQNIQPGQSLTGSMISTNGIGANTEKNNIMISSITSDKTGNPIRSAMYEFNVCLEIKEKVSKNAYSAVTRDRACFKIRCNTDKEVCITVKQIPTNSLQPLLIERCFGVLLSPKKLTRQADMQLLDMASMGYIKIAESGVVCAVGGSHVQPGNSSYSNINTPQSILNAGQSAAVCLLPYQIRAEWKANDKAFEQLNLESQKTYLTVAVDLVIKGIQEPVRFVIETQVTIISQNEFRMNLFSSKRPLMQKFYLQLRDTAEGTWEVESIDHSDEIVEPPQPSLLNFKSLSKMVRSTSTISMDFDDLSPTDYSSDGDEPLISGTGEVSKDCSQDRLDEWCPVLQEWENTQKKPKNLAYLVRTGIPEALRCRIWQKLANVENKVDMTDLYRVLITKETHCESVIQRDIKRTFPAHKFFRESGGFGQDSLYKVSKAYAVYDEEVKYCQGLGYIAASLLLHMPEEEAFCVFVALMYDYELRELYKPGFDTLYLRLYQLDRLMKDYIPDLYEHFVNSGIESHMFASQWFLTLFTARFPLYFVYYILDVFLLDGMVTLFQVAMTLLNICKKDLLELDFEGIMKYFRVTLPKKCRSEEQAKRIMKFACEWKIKKLKKYEEEYLVKKSEQEREEMELKQYEMRFSEEKRSLQNDIVQLQTKIDEANRNDKKNSGIILDYKQIIQRQEQQITKLNDILDDVTKTVSNCSQCSSNVSASSPLHKSNKDNCNNDNKDNVDAPLGPLDPLNVALQRIRELESVLAQTKVRLVEAECANDGLNHQLSTTITEMQSKNTWQPWFSKTLNSLQEKVQTKRETGAFQSYTNPEINDKVRYRNSSPQAKKKSLSRQRTSFDSTTSTTTATKSQGNSESHKFHPILKDSLSFNNLK